MWWVSAYQVLYVIVTIVGLVSSGYFIVTWLRGVTKKMTLEAFDAGGWVVVLFALFLFIQANVLTVGLPVPTNINRAVQSLLMYFLIVSVVIVRAVLWRRIKSESKKEEEEP